MHARKSGPFLDGVLSLESDGIRNSGCPSFFPRPDHFLRLIKIQLKLKCKMVSFLLNLQQADCLSRGRLLPPPCCYLESTGQNLPNEGTLLAHTKAL